MFVTRTIRASLVLPAAVLATLPVAAAASGAPAITAKPKELMVDQSTTLSGRGFPANRTIELAECGKTFWLAPAEPCLTEDTKTVKTNRAGRFRTTFRAGVCPESEPGPQPTSRYCYVGELKYGEDTGELIGAAKLLVTYP